MWMIRHFGPVKAVRYERLRRKGVKIDWRVAFTPDELAVLSEHFDPAPWLDADHG